MDTLDLAQSDVVDLVGGEIGGGVIGEQRFVILRALREAPDPVLRRCDRLLAFHLGEQPLIGGAGVGVPGARRSTLFDICALSAVERGDLGAVILEDRIVIARREQVFDVRDDIGVDPVGRHHPGGRTGSRLRGQRIDHRAQPRDAADIGGCALGAVDAVDVDQEGGQLALRAVHLVEDIAIVAKRVERGAARGHGVEQSVAERILARQCGKLVIGAHGRRSGLQQILFALFGGGGEIAPATVILVADPAIGLGQRRERKLLGVVGFEQLSQILVGLLRPHRDIVARALRGGAGRQCQSRYRNSNQSETHRSIPRVVFIQGSMAQNLSDCQPCEIGGPTLGGSRLFDGIRAKKGAASEETAP